MVERFVFDQEILFADAGGPRFLPRSPSMSREFSLGQQTPVVMVSENTAMLAAIRQRQGERERVHERTISVLSFHSFLWSSIHDMGSFAHTREDEIAFARSLSWPAFRDFLCFISPTGDKCTTSIRSRELPRWRRFQPPSRNKYLVVDDQIRLNEYLVVE